MAWLVQLTSLGSESYSYPQRLHRIGRPLTCEVADQVVALLAVARLMNMREVR